MNAYYLAFNTYNVEVSLAWMWAAASVWLAWLWAMEARGWLALVASVVLAVLAILTYQDFSFAIIAGVLVVQLAHLLGCRSRDVYTTREAIRQTLSPVHPDRRGTRGAAVVSLLIVERSGRIESLGVVPGVYGTWVTLQSAWSTSPGDVRAQGRVRSHGR